MPVVNIDYLNYYPGHISLGFLFFELAKKGEFIVDHLRGAEDYKYSWTNHETMLYDVIYEKKKELFVQRFHRS